MFNIINRCFANSLHFCSFVRKKTYAIKITLIALLFSSLIYVRIQKSFEHFEISRGDSSQDYILTLPQEEIVKLMNQMQNSSA